MKGVLDKISAFKSINLEDSVAQTLDRRFRSEISTIVPDCYVDMLKRGADGQENSLVIFTKTREVEAIQVDELALSLVNRGIRTLGILEPHCDFKVFVNENPDGIKKDIKTYLQNYQMSNNLGNVDITIDIDSFLFEGTGKKYYGYTNFFLPYFKKQNELCFEPFLKAGGAIVSVQDRYAPITRFVLESSRTDMDMELSTLFCEISDHEVHIWTAVVYGNGVFAPLSAECANSFSSVDFLLDSVVAQTVKQYHFWNPNLAVFIDVRESSEHRSQSGHDDIKALLANTCEHVVDFERGEISRNACLHGALLLVSDNKKKKDENENGTQRRLPRVNVTPKEWTHNYLIPITLKEFYRKGMSFIAGFLFLICLCWGGYWYIGSLRVLYERDINALQANTAKNLRDFSSLKERSEEFSQLGDWRLFPDLATQYSALSSFLTRNNCLLVRAVFHSKPQDLAPKLLEDIRLEFERSTKSAINVLNMSGVWELSFRLPVAGVSTVETRKNIIAALRKDAAAAFSTGPRDLTSPKSLLVFNEGQGQNIMNMLRNENGLNAIFLVWKNPNSASGR
jgi:hypothetical protein